MLFLFYFKFREFVCEIILGLLSVNHRKLSLKLRFHFSNFCTFLVHLLHLWVHSNCLQTALKAVLTLKLHFNIFGLISGKIILAYLVWNLYDKNTKLKNSMYLGSPKYKSFF